MKEENIINLADAIWELSNYLMRLQNEPDKLTLRLHVNLAIAFAAIEIQREVRNVRQQNKEYIQDTLIWAREECRHMNHKK